ncbi:MAG TPA: response regulator transcription factor [Chthoniobacteraceae bacterium]|jgi:DNA-binding NarL/FixJ family response regulator
MTAPSDKIRLLLVDDHFIVLAGLVSSLECEPDLAVVGQASTGQEAVAAYAQLRPDVTLLDGRLPDLMGVEAAQQILAQDPGARIIMLTVNETEEHIYRALDAGVRAYLPKTTKRAELLEVIRLVHGGGLYQPPAVRAARCAGGASRGRSRSQSQDTSLAQAGFDHRPEVESSRERWRWWILRRRSRGRTRSAPGPVVARAQGEHLIEWLLVGNEARVEQLAPGPKERGRVQAKKVAQAGLGVIAQPLVVGGADQQAIKTQGRRSAAAQMAVGEEPVVNPAEAARQGRAQTAGIKGRLRIVMEF